MDLLILGPLPFKMLIRFDDLTEFLMKLYYDRKNTSYTGCFDPSRLSKIAT